jgi:hypothetical protein
VAPLQRWVAYVWSAIALTPDDELPSLVQSGLGLVAIVLAPELLSLPLSAPGQIASVAESAARSGRSGAAGPSSTSESNPGDSTVIFPGGGDALSLLVVFLISGLLLASLIYAVRRELGPRRRWRLWHRV